MKENIGSRLAGLRKEIDRRIAQADIPQVFNRTGTMLREGGQQISAGVNGALDAGTLGLSDRYQAFELAKLGLGGGRNLVEGYRNVRELQKAQDRYEAKRHPTARNIGQVVGTVGSIAASGGLGAAPQAGARLAPHAARGAGIGLRSLARRFGPQAAISGAGALTSLGGQAASDAAAGEWSGPKAYGAAAGGGGAGALATLYGGPRTGAVTEAGVTAALRSALTGAPISWETAGRDAVAGAHLARFGDILGTRWADGLDAREKGRLGEAMTAAKSRLRGETFVDKQKARSVPGGHTFVDRIVRYEPGGPEVLLEAKMGRSARLSPRQRQARALYGDRYQVDSWLPEDVGTALGGFTALIGGQAGGRDDEP